MKRIIIDIVACSNCINCVSRYYKGPRNYCEAFDLDLSLISPASQIHEECRLEDVEEEK